MSEIELLIRTTRKFTAVVIVFIICVLSTVLVHLALSLNGLAPEASPGEKAAISRVNAFWSPPDLKSMFNGDDSALVRYGYDLIMHTARYLGPNGKVARISNGMNCTNCHLEGGTKVFAANYSAVASTYPKFRNRSGTREGFEKRINDCLQRSLNGDTLSGNSREMKAMVAYLKWVGKDVPRGHVPNGAGLIELPWLSRSADTVSGRLKYRQHCSRCHGVEGKGVKSNDEIEWKYPPLWGDESYNTGAGLYRISRFAAFIKANMPFGVTHDAPVLSDEEAWDIAAYVNSQERPLGDFPQDWPDISRKPVDHPFGPYSDHFTEAQHKYGPWGLIKRRSD